MDKPVTEAATKGSEAADVFKNIAFYLDDNIDEQIKKQLKDGGAQREFYISNLVTHVITDSPDFKQMQQVKDLKINIVTSDWVIMSTKCSAVLPAEPFSPEKNQLFSGVVSCPSQIPKEDRDAIWAMITYYGGSCQINLNSKCTHLIIGKAIGRKFDCAQQQSANIKIITPEWVIDSIKEKKCLNELDYYPEAMTAPLEAAKSPPPQNDSTSGKIVPKFSEANMTPSVPSLMTSVGDNLKIAVKKETTTTRDNDAVETDRAQTMMPSMPLKPCASPEDINFKTATSSNTESHVPELKTLPVADSATTTSTTAIKENPVFGAGDSCLTGYVIAFVDYKERMPLETYIVWLEAVNKFGGVVEEAYSSRCTHLICLHQHSDDFKKAMRDGKKIATAHWLNDVLVEKRITRPHSTLHFPVPFSDVIPACRGLLITVSGYSGDERVRLKNIIFILGAQYTGYMCKSHTHLVCKEACGDKYLRAKDWGIPIVNATWLRDIVQSGEMKTLTADSTYFNLSMGNDFSINKDYCRHMIDAWSKPLFIPELEAVSPEAPKMGSFLPGKLVEKPPQEIVKPVQQIVEPLPQDTAKPLPQDTAQPLPQVTAQPLPQVTSMPLLQDAAQQLPQDKVEPLQKQINLHVQEIHQHAQEIHQPLQKFQQRPAQDILASASVEKRKISMECPAPITAEKRKSPEPPAERMDEPDAKQRKMEPLSIDEHVVKETVSEPSLERELPRVLFTGLTGPAVQKMSQFLKKLRGEIAKNVRTCTHLVAPKITRTVKFLSAISICKHIVTPLWVEESFKAGKLLDEVPFRLKDPESEHVFGFHLQASLERAQKKRVFQNLKFVVTPRIVPQPSQMKEIIECAGGEIVQVANEEELATHIGDPAEKKGTTFVITCEEDRMIWVKPAFKELDVHSVELVLSGVMKQDVECESHRF